MSALVLDVGALIAVDRGDRAAMARLQVAAEGAVGLRTNAMVVAQVWRGGGRQASLARVLAATAVTAIIRRLVATTGVAVSVVPV